MKKCPFCAEEIQGAAVVCKHCGRDLPVAIVPAPDTTQPKKKTSALTWVVVGIFALMLIGALVPRPTSSRPPSTTPTSRTMAVKAAWNSIALQITNNSDAEAAGKPMTVYINGTPPFTYKTTSVVPAVGESVQLPLIEFTMKNGDRFNPMAKAVTVAWVGGSGYDYESFGK